MGQQMCEVMTCKGINKNKCMFLFGSNIETSNHPSFLVLCHKYFRVSMGGVQGNSKNSNLNV